MQPTTGSGDKYVDVEWLSVYFYEKERLFAKSYNLLIMDILYVPFGDELMSHRPYLRAFTLFSGLFDGHFLPKLKGQRKAEKMLLDLIVVYGQNNNIDVGHGNDGNIYVPLYVQQIFYNLVRSFKEKRKHWIIPSEFEKIGDALKSQLFRFKENGDDDEQRSIELSPFLDSICYGVEHIVFLKEYIWVLTDDQIHELREGGPGYEIWSELEYEFKVSESERISFVFNLQRPLIGTNKTCFGIKVTKQVGSSSYYFGSMSVVIDGDTDWELNNWKLYNMKEEAHSTMFAFNDSSLQTLQSLTLRTAIRLRGHK